MSEKFRELYALVKYKLENKLPIDGILENDMWQYTNFLKYAGIDLKDLRLKIESRLLDE